MLGSLLFSPLADRIGRRGIIVGSTLAFGVLTLATTLAHDVETLTALLFCCWCSGPKSCTGYWPDIPAGRSTTCCIRIWTATDSFSAGSTWAALGFHAPVPLGTTKDNYDFMALLYRAVGTEFVAEIEHTGFWDLCVATADYYGSGRVFIAGDAAHYHPSYGG